MQTGASLVGLRAALCPTRRDSVIANPNQRIHIASIEGHNLIQTEIRVECSKGTYIRALARDLGEALGSGAFLHSLRRTKTGPFRVEEALDLEEVTALL